MVQALVVTLAVLVAAAYVGWSLLPVRSRFALLSRVDAALARRAAATPGVDRLHLLRARLVAPLLRRAAAGGGCGSCGSAAHAAAAPRRGTPR